jgi:hypothetical protein
VAAVTFAGPLPVRLFGPGDGRFSYGLRTETIEPSRLPTTGPTLPGVPAHGSELVADRREAAGASRRRLATVALAALPPLTLAAAGTTHIFWPRGGQTMLVLAAGWACLAWAATATATVGSAR